MTKNQRDIMIGYYGNLERRNENGKTIRTRLYK